MQHAAGQAISSFAHNRAAPDVHPRRGQFPQSLGPPTAARTAASTSADCCCLQIEFGSARRTTPRVAAHGEISSTTGPFPCTRSAGTPATVPEAVVRVCRKAQQNRLFGQKFGGAVKAFLLSVLAMCLQVDRVIAATWLRAMQRR